MGGLSEVQRRGIPSAALAATAEIARAVGGPPIRRSVESGFRLEAYGIRGEVFFPGAGHGAPGGTERLDHTQASISAHTE